MESLICDECGAESGWSLVCAGCRKQMSAYAHSKYTELWHKAIRALAPVDGGGRLQCFHCEQFFDEDCICGDHFPYTKGSRPDLRYDFRNGVPCCARCNTSGARTRKDWRLHVDRVLA